MGFREKLCVLIKPVLEQFVFSDQPEKPQERYLEKCVKITNCVDVYCISLLESHHLQVLHFQP